MVDAAGGDPPHSKQPGSADGHGALCQPALQDPQRALGTQVAKPPLDSTFPVLLAQLDVEGFEAMLQQWIAAQPGVNNPVDTLVCDGKTLRGQLLKSQQGQRVLSLR